ncbi:MAG: undecaprenyldiphospho-muramoylpentapeptide beta-N-acetylglucosaminyltransferase [Clostridiales bacterium]|nr:undecaprenyldiphospho-muramoylpentapeptide beta-N-acetylglucosaminyltransferase [Clostridiales bacterium]
MKVILTGGGTGGHIYPAIAIADQIKAQYPDAEILFVGTSKGMEKDLVPQAGYPIRFITASGLDRRNLLKNFKTARDVLKGLAEAKAILQEFKPDAVIGTGGYVCGPIVKAAQSMKIRTFLHEQNAFPGVTNKLLAKGAEKVFISFAEAANHFKGVTSMVVTGNPIRKDFFSGTKEEYRAKLGIPQDAFVVLCFGGSRGAYAINTTMTAAVDSLKDVSGLKLYFVTGRYYYDSITEELARKDVAAEGGNVVLFPYVNNMHEYLLAADLVISRSGALTVSEITACGKASVLIPSPNVTGNHQFFNAKVVADRGGAVLLEEKDLTPERLVASILAVKSDAEKKASMEAAARAVGTADAAKAIVASMNL